MNVIIKESLHRGMTFQKPLILEVHHFTFSWVFHKKGKGETKLYPKPYPPLSFKIVEASDLLISFLDFMTDNLLTVQ